MNAAVIGVPECSEIPEVGPKDTDRDRDVKPARLQRAGSRHHWGAQGYYGGPADQSPKKRQNRPKTPDAGHAMLTLTAVEQFS
jgi:hypothetical protein